MTKETTPVAARRRALLQRLLPAGAPRLWCPLLTHYRDDGSLDLERTARQLDAIRPFVGGLLLAGSTGDGWELDEEQRQRLIAEVLPLARERGFAVLLGVLKPTAAQMHQAINATVAALCAQAGSEDPADAFARCGVAGLTLCAPHGALSQDAIGSALDALLATGAPVSLYQLPQVTRNRIAPATYAALVARHANLLLLKDTSGEDTLAACAREADGVLLLRGAEGGYACHPKVGGGCYDGALLSTANGLGAALGGVFDALGAGRRDEAEALSRRIEAVADAVFAAAAALPVGNAFTNANKAIDHVMAHGEAAATTAEAPRLRAGSRLPRQLIATAAAALAGQGLAPARGYLQN